MRCGETTPNELRRHHHHLPTQTAPLSPPPTHLSTSTTTSNSLLEDHHHSRTPPPGYTHRGYTHLLLPSSGNLVLLSHTLLAPVPPPRTKAWTQHLHSLPLNVSDLVESNASHPITHPPTPARTHARAHILSDTYRTNN